MSDKEVGDLWGLYSNASYLQNRHTVCALILKLIEERTALWYWRCNFKETSDQCTMRSLADFSIPEAEYLKAKENP